MHKKMMRCLESVLKIAFLVLSLALILTRNFSTPGLQVFVSVAFILGMVLVFNHDASYNFKQTKKDLAIRKVEGIIFVLFSILAVVYLY